VKEFLLQKEKVKGLGGFWGEVLRRGKSLSGRNTIASWYRLKKGEGGEKQGQKNGGDSFWRASGRGP